MNGRFEARLPESFNSSNPRSVQVYENETLSSAVRSRGINGDIFTLVAYLMTGNNNEGFLNKQLYKSKRKVLDVCGWSNSNFNSNGNKSVHNSWLRELKDKRSKVFDLSKIEPNPVLPESILDGFIIHPHKLFLDDDISISTQVEFEIGVDIHTERVIIPIRNKDSKLIGIRGRATKEDDLDYKYLPIYSFRKGQELYGIHKTLPYIQEEDTVILWEAEKSVHKSWQMGVKYSLSQMGSDITRIQAEMIKRISPSIKIILGFDKGVTVDEIKQMAKAFGDYDELYAIVDVDNLLTEKMSPADASPEIFNTLIKNHCYKIFPK